MFDNSTVTPFDYRKPSDETVVVIGKFRNLYADLYREICNLPQSRERSVALTDLETSGMWLIKGLVLNENK